MKALLDSGSSANFISGTAALRAGLKPYRKQEPYFLHVANGEEMPIESGITHALVTKLNIQGHQEKIHLDVFGLAAHDVVLGLPWLREHNPRIDWKNSLLSFDDCRRTRNQKPAHRQCSMVDEKMINSLTSQKTRSQTRTVGLDIQEDMTKVLEKRATPAIPVEYKEFEKLFQEELGLDALPKHQPWDHEIILEEGKTPGFQPIYGMSEKELQELKTYIDVNVKKGFIRKSESPAGFPVMFVPKKNGKLRLCVDFRKLNDMTIKNRYPLPNISELRDRLAHAKIFTALDLRGAYNLIRMKEGEEWKTAFRTRYGHYEYTVMPFGLTNAPATCQALVNDVLREHLDIFVVAYLDDILIYSQSEKEHKEHVYKILTLLQQHHLLVDPDKCKWHQEEVEFLGHIVGKDGVKMSPEKIKVVKEWPTPTTVKEVQAFIGFANFNRQFIKNFSKIAIPLTELTKKENPFNWTEKHDKAFDTLKQACIEPPVLVAFRNGEPLRFETDASDLAIGMCAKQERDGKWHPIAYHSRKFTSAEENYDVHDKELLAIVVALEHWRIYAESCSDLVIFSDHKNLVNFTTTKVLNRRQVRWSETLGNYKFKIVYTPGKDNGRADALSRRSDIAGTKKITESTILKVQEDGSLGPANVINNLMMKVGIDVPEELQEQIIRQHHDDPVHGHPGIARTMELITRNYQFRNMKDKVTTYIKKCADCQKNKHSTHAQYGEMQPMELPQEPWTDISMDFVTGLPPSRDPATGLTYDSILVIVDRFTKYALMIPFRRDYTAVQLAHVLKDRLIRDHGIPKTIISDRDKLFTSNYWATLMAEIGIKRKLSTAYHPQTDGQTERTNRTMKTYLKIYSNTSQDNWVSLLAMAQMAYNNKASEATGQTPYFANHGKHPNLFERTLPSPKAEAAIKSAEEMKKIHGEMSSKLLHAQNQSISYVNQKRKTAPQLKRGDKVYLHTKNLRTKRPSKGLDNVKVGPFLISKQNGPVTYTLELPPDAKIHPRFHVSLLEPADPETPLQRTFRYETEEDNEFEVEELIDYREIGRQDFQDTAFIQEWLVKWKDYPHSENTWEPESNLQNCKQMLKEARDKHNAHYYTGFSPEKILKEIRRHELQPDQELLTYLVNKQLLTKQTSKKYLN
jgi:transposase InsO family protein